jgi:drug/metabolite transporter (DMT)-like permease
VRGRGANERYPKDDEGVVLSIAGTVSPGVSRPLKGILAMIAGMAFLIMSDAVSKHLAQVHPLGQVMCLRQAACLLFVVPFVWRGSGLAVLRPRNVSLQIVRGLVFLVSSFFIIWSLSVLPLPTVTAITFVAPILIALLSAPMLGERVNATLWGATLLGFIGMIFIIRPGSADFHWTLLLPVGAAFFSSVRDVMARILARTDNSISILFWSSLVIVIGAAFSALLGWRPVSMAQWGWYLLAGAVNFCAHFFIIESLRLGRAAVVAPFRYTSLLWSAVLGYAIWGDVPGGWVWIGSAILIVSGLWIMQSQKS